MYPQYSIFGRWRLHPVGVVLIAVGMWLVYLMLFQFITVSVAGLLGVDFGQLLTVMGGDWAANVSTEVINTTKAVLASGQIAFVVTAVLMAIGAGSIRNELQVQERTPVTYLALTTAATVCAIPVLQYTTIPAEWFTQVDSLRGFGEWAVAKEKELEQMTLRLMEHNLPLNLLVVAVLPGICEEVLFRGFVQSQLQRIAKPGVAIWLQAALFSAIHLQFQGFLARMLIGGALGYLRRWSGSLWPCIVAHFVNNAVNVLIAYLALQGTLPSNLIQHDYVVPVWIGLPAVALTAFLFYLLYKRRIATAPPAA